MKTLVASLVIVILPASLLTSCTYTVISSRTEERMREARVVESGVEYSVQRQSLLGDTLVLNLGRACWQTVEGHQDTVLLENRQYDTTGAWIGIGSLLFVGLTSSLFMYLVGYGMVDFEEMSGWSNQDEIDKGETLMALSPWVAIGTLATSAALGAGVVIFDGGEPRQAATLVDRASVRRGPTPSEDKSHGRQSRSECALGLRNSKL